MAFITYWNSMTSPLIEQITSTKHNLVLTAQEGSHRACLAARLYQGSTCPMVAVLPDAKSAQQFMDDLLFFAPGLKGVVQYFPGYHILPYKNLSYHRETSTSRLAVLSRLLHSNHRRFFMVTHVDNLLQKMIPRKTILDTSELVMANEDADRNQLVETLEACGYNRASLVEDPGEYSVRGDILDVFSPGEIRPVRMEFFGDLVESIRSFSPYTQRGVKELSETVIAPATEVVIPKDELPHVLARLRKAGGRAGLSGDQIRDYVNQARDLGRFPGIESMLSIVYEELDTLFEYFPSDTFFLLDSPDVMKARAEDMENKALLNHKTVTSENRLCVAPNEIYLPHASVEERLGRFQRTILSSLSVEGDPSLPVIPYTCHDNQGLKAELHRSTGSDTPLQPLINWCTDFQEKGFRILFVIRQEAQVKRLVSLLAPYGISPVQCDSFEAVTRLSPGIYFYIGHVSSGFVNEADSLAMLTEDEIFGKKRIRRRSTTGRDLKTELIAPEELKNGDIVVHMEHGVGRYEGLCNLKVGAIRQDFILIVYQEEDKLYLPVDRIEMIGKYIGVDGYTPVLDKIGSKSWIKSKAKAKAEVEKLAADLLDLYAKRRVQKGYSFSRPDNIYNDFEASFPHEETRGQLKAIDDVQLDMESDVPMDRLVCGDVGYGKTEVAVRAAFKAVNDSKQVAIVVPTTILAEQHLNTFRSRFEKYPVTIECLSRFRSRKEQTDILKRLAQGQVDIVIGTHRLLQKDVAFPSLGLLVIDEEQRFGVKHKEALKKKRSSVDVLALSATPIPRTLHLSLTGMRDISVIATPPASRQPIVSYISKYEDAIVKDAVQKELARKGQVFFVHNNVKTIHKVAQQLQELVPDAKIGVAHGQLSEAELEKVMFQFIHYEINVLVCTTIVESGLDISSANTMIINKAERFGLSQIYQLRGRIGRGDHQAYAYLFISDESRLTKDARKRLSALMEHKDLGSGFQIAMKDLQIRGAGTALGASQSGHIAAVGYDMFLKLLDQAVGDIKGEKTVEPLEPEINAAMSSGFPDHYVESVEQRLTLYRRLSRLTRLGDIADMKKELIDRYGKLPKEAENMLLKIMLRVLAIKAGVRRLDITPESLTLTFSPDHMGCSIPDLINVLPAQPSYTFVKKDSIRFKLGRKQSPINKALLKTREILKRLG